MPSSARNKKVTIEHLADSVRTVAGGAPDPRRGRAACLGNHARRLFLRRRVVACASPDRRHLPSFPTRRSSDLEICTGRWIKCITPAKIIYHKPPAKMSSADRMIPSELLRSEEHTSELQSRGHLVCRLLLETKKSLSSTSRTVSGQSPAAPQTLAAVVLLVLATMPVDCFCAGVLLLVHPLTADIYPLSLHDALPIWKSVRAAG